MKTAELVCRGLFAFACCFPIIDATATLAAEKVDLEAVRKKYAVAATDLEVVQNRTYTKAGKFEFGVLGGSVSSDPFLTIQSAGGLLGYHFSETFAFNLLYWRDFVKASSALTSFETENGFTVNTNRPKTFMGGELSFNPIYGKLSVLGKAIIYYDMHLLLGAGLRDTESGRYFTGSFGLGQQIFLTQLLALRMDYRVLQFKENVLEQVKSSDRGNVVSTRNVSSGTFSFGVSMLLGGY